MAGEAEDRGQQGEGTSAFQHLQDRATHYKMKWHIFTRPNFLKRQLGVRKRVKNFLLIHCEALIH